MGGYIELVQTGHSNSSCTLLVGAIAALPGVEMKTLETAAASTSKTFDTLDPISPSCAGDSGTSKHAFDGAIGE